MEETHKRDGRGRGEKKRRHDDELDAVVAELAWRPAVAAALAAVVAAAAAAQSSSLLMSSSSSSLLVLLVSIILLWHWDCLIFW